MTHQKQLESYNAGWNKGRWPNDPNYSYSATDFADANEFATGLAHGKQDRELDQKRTGEGA